MRIYTISNEEAICNDGTQSRLHYRAAPAGPNQNKWIFRFEGGDMCHSDSTCYDRAYNNEFTVDFITAPKTPLVFSDNRGGMMSGSPEQNPNFWDYNAVHTHYCSSDMYIGNANPEDNEMNWYFKGSEILKGTFQEAALQFNLSLAETVIVVGYSAGGAGMVAMSEWIEEFISAEAPGATLSFIADSAYFMESLNVNNETEMDCHDHDSCPYGEQMQQFWEYVNPVVPESCLSRGLTWECVVVEHSLADLTTNELITIIQPMYDNRVMWMLGNPYYTPLLDQFFDEAAYNLTTSITERASSWHIPNCCNHDATNRDWWKYIAIDGVTVEDIIMEFSENPSPIRYQDDTCSDPNITTCKDTNPTCVEGSCITTIDDPPPHID